MRAAEVTCNGRGPRSVRFVVGLLSLLVANAEGRDADRWLDVWPDRAPGETRHEIGGQLPRRENEDPPATRIEAISRPRLAMFAPTSAKPTGAAVVILPGGGYRYVVTDKEGSEVAEWLNHLGITAFVLHYRTQAASDRDEEIARPDWKRPVEDGNRSIRLLRANAASLDIDVNRIGVMGFSAGGQAAALVACRSAEYGVVDGADAQSSRPDFAILVYPWRLIDSTGQLMSALRVTRQTPTTILIHAHDDSSTPLGSVTYYSALKQMNVSAELHVYQDGGHGYGMRASKDAAVSVWPDAVERWLAVRGLLNP